ncbi:MAG: hypothetical protein KAS32_14330 [Candidatus Peribacteraceae bacterium]|nr:hypothetical protein [Candidatus Peribacteraceae bacterium]
MTKEYIYMRVDYTVTPMSDEFREHEFREHDDRVSLSYQELEEGNVINSLWYTYDGGKGIRTYLLVTEDGIKSFDYSVRNLTEIDTIIYKYLRLGKTIEEALEISMIISL